MSVPSALEDVSEKSAKKEFMSAVAVMELFLNSEM